MPKPSSYTSVEAFRWISPLACFAPLLIGALALTAPSSAVAGNNYVKSMDLDLTSSGVRILSSDGETYDTIQDGDVSFVARIGIDLRHPGAFDGVAIHLGECTGHHGGCYERPLIFSTTVPGRDFFTEETFTVPANSIPTIDMRLAMFAACNAKSDEAVGAGDDIITQLDIGATLAADTRISHLKNIVEPGTGLASHGLGLGEYSKTKAFPFKLKLACAPLPLPQQAGPKPVSVDLRVKQKGDTCPKDTEVTAYIDYDKPMTGRFKIHHNGKPGKTIEIKAREMSLAGKTFYRIERLERYKLDPGKHNFQVKVIGGGKSEKTSVDVDCPPFAVSSTWLTYEVENKDTCKKQVVETATIHANRPGDVPYRIETQGGLVVTQGIAYVARKGDQYVATRTRTLSMGAFDQMMRLKVVNDPSVGVTQTPLKVECVFKPTDTGASTDLAPETRPEDPPPVHPTLAGDFSFIDNGGTHCPRQGKALVNFKTSKPDNVHWSLDCTNGHFSGVAQTAPSPKGGFIAPALVSFDIKQTTDAKCALKTVAPGKPKVHTLKGHTFQCVRTTSVGGADDLAPETRPAPQKPDKPGKAVKQKKTAKPKFGAGKPTGLKAKGAEAQRSLLAPR